MIVTLSKTSEGRFLKSVLLAIVKKRSRIVES
jgi:hypothetical protein